MSIAHDFASKLDRTPVRAERDLMGMAVHYAECPTDPGQPVSERDCICWSWPRPLPGSCKCGDSACSGL